ncbi:MAG: TolC family protein [Bacteroidota bacterium]
MKQFVILSFLFFSLTAFTQELSLQECVDLALQNNIALKRSELQKHTAEINLKSTRSGILPQLNASYNLGINNGRSIDPYTNDYIDQQLKFSNAGLSLYNQLFKGFELRNSIQRDRFNLQASEAETEQAQQQLILDVTLAYFQILNNRDLLELARLRLEATKKQTDRLKSLYDQGEGNPADFTDILGQISNDEASVVDAETQLERSVLELANLLNLDTLPKVQEMAFLAELEKYKLSATEVYEDALNNLATIEAKRLRIEASKEDVQVSRSFYSPEISLFAQLNTNYSSVARTFNETGTRLVETGNFITLDEVNYPVKTNQTLFTDEKIGYLDQLNNNLNSVVGVAVDIPIFNGLRAKRTVQLKKIELEDSKLELEDTKNDLQQEIRMAWNQMQASYRNYHLLQEQVEAYEKSYQVNEVRFTNGVSNFVEYIFSKNNLDRARINMANARYEYMIRVKILEYYRGA